MDHEQPVRDREEGMDHVLDPEHGHPGCLDTAQFLDELPRLVLGQPAGDFVEQQEPRPGGEGAGQLETLAIEQPEPTRAPVRLPEKTRGAEDLDRLVVGVLLAPLSSEGGRRDQVLEHGHGAEWLRDLVGAPHPHPAPPMRRIPHDVAPLELDAPRVGAELAADEVEEGRFPRAVGTEDSQGFALGDGEGDPVRHPQGAEALGDRHKGEDRRHGPAGTTRGAAAFRPRGSAARPHCSR